MVCEKVCDGSLESLKRWKFSIGYNVMIAMVTGINGKGYLVLALTFQMNDRKDSSKFAHHPILDR